MTNGSDAVGGYHPTCVVSGNERQRNYAGVVNAHVEGGPPNGQLLLYSPSSNRAPHHVMACLTELGVTESSQLQLDGGNSVFLTIDGQMIIREYERNWRLTHAMVVCGP